MTERKLLLIPASLVLAVLLTGCQKDNAGDKQKNRPPATVSAVTVERRDLPVLLQAEGHVSALNTVEIRPQVTSLIRTIHFREGAAITKGQLLFTLESADDEAQLNRARAQARQIEAQLREAEKNLTRTRELAAARFLSDSAVDTAASKVDALQAQLAAARADIAAAGVKLGYTRITAPISGRAGRVDVHPGSLAQQNSATALVTITELDPIAVEFSLPERDLPALLDARSKGQIRVTATTGELPAQEGELSFIDNTVDPATGTIRLKASFRNPKQQFWPGQFVRVSVAAGITPQAVVLPAEAVQTGPDGRFVYLIGADKTVSAKPVTLLRLQDRMAVIDGLQGGERVVRDGGQNLRPGAEVREASAPAAQKNGHEKRASTASQAR
ncbi:efflux RND transporter periplasmic adaptor subunit [Chitinilyticum aquatile]|uniref:efflux RND transporter periplasmic adaptor subunit n=1 Tax=Chitinilyticum aquatile TaxID=362520 RepID=UPI0003FA8A2B|nr:efflux RND transporter periplasmic adaptor subunit [Chitinilyticum aquatile]